MLLIVILTAIGIAGAIAGVLLARQISKIDHLKSIAGGLFLGMSAFLIFPEAFRSGSWPVVALFSVAGCFAFAWVERNLDHSLEFDDSRARTFPVTAIFAAIAIHNLLDGWNMAVALQVPSSDFARAFSIGMGLHKWVGGLAIGPMFASVSRRAARNVLIAGTAEAVTFAGAIVGRTLMSSLGAGWTVWFLAATGGSFLFLAFHALADAKRGAGLHQTFRFGALGFVVVATAALFH